MVALGGGHVEGDQASAMNLGTPAPAIPSRSASGGTGTWAMGRPVSSVTRAASASCVNGAGPVMWWMLRPVADTSAPTADRAQSSRVT